MSESFDWNSATSEEHKLVARTLPTDFERFAVTPRLKWRNYDITNTKKASCVEGGMIMIHAIDTLKIYDVPAGARPDVQVNLAKRLSRTISSTCQIAAFVNLEVLVLDNMLRNCQRLT